MGPSVAINSAGSVLTTISGTFPVFDTISFAVESSYDSSSDFIWSERSATEFGGVYNLIPRSLYFLCTEPYVASAKKEIFLQKDLELKNMEY